MWSLFAFHIDWDFHFGEAILSIVCIILTWMGRAVVKSIKGLIERAEQGFEDIEQHAEVIDLHTDAIVKAGWAKGVGIPRVNRRKRHRVDFDGA